MRTVWALTRGQYSDYSVVAVFPTKADAEAALDLARRTDVEWSAADSMTTLTMYDEGETPKVITVYSRQINIWDDGTSGGDRATVTHWWEYDWEQTPADGRPIVRFVRAPCHEDKGGRLDICGRDEQAVNQSFNDNLFRIIVRAEETGKAVA